MKNNCFDCGKKVHSFARRCIRCRDCEKIKRESCGAVYPYKKPEKKKYNPSPKQRYNSYKNGAIIRNHDFDLTEEQFMTFWDKPCHYCEQPINGIGIDRVDNSIGYVMSNCVPCCKTCNWMKATLSYNHFISKCAQIAKAHQHKDTIS